MNPIRFRLTAAFLIVSTIAQTMACVSGPERGDDHEYLREHVEWLSSEQREGRLAGTIQEAEAANYIADLFMAYGLTPAGDDFTYQQQFTLTGPLAQVMNRDGATLGVMPDYNYSGDGFRIDGVREGQPAFEGGMETGDIIIRMGEFPVSDIYSYMNGLSEFTKGDQIVVTILRNGLEMEIEITF